MLPTEQMFTDKSLTAGNDMRPRCIGDGCSVKCCGVEVQNAAERQSGKHSDCAVQSVSVCWYGGTTCALLVIDNSQETDVHHFHDLQ